MIKKNTTDKQKASGGNSAKVNMTDYSKMTDLEINKAVAEALGYEVLQNSSRIKAVCKKDGKISTHNWCNLIKDWTQLLVDNRIDIRFSQFHEHVSAEKRIDGILFDYTDMKPGRAVAICFLMIKEAEHD